MPVSSGLEAYFDKNRKKQSVKRKLDDIYSQVDPAFLLSFEKFRTQVLEIVEETPEASERVEEEVTLLWNNLKRTHRVNNLKKSAAIIEKIS